MNKEADWLASSFCNFPQSFVWRNLPGTITEGHLRDTNIKSCSYENIQYTKTNKLERVNRFCAIQFIRIQTALLVFCHFVRQITSHARAVPSFFMYNNLSFRYYCSQTPGRISANHRTCLNVRFPVVMTSSLAANRDVVVVSRVGTLAL